MSGNIHCMRSSCSEEPFLEEHLSSKEPFSQFDAWFREACACKEIRDPNAMCLSTATREGRVSARYVLLKEYNKEGFKFFTNYNSRKGCDISENPFVAATFYWEPFGHAVRIEGTAEKLRVEESERYFHERPLPSRLAASASQQSKPLLSREALCARVKELEAQYGKDVPRPEHWGGYVIRPTMVEFFQSQTDRLSDRIRFRRPESSEEADGVYLHEGEEGWLYERLAP